MELTSILASYRRRVREKWKYEEEVKGVEHASFTPIIFSVSGGCSKLADTLVKEKVSFVNYWKRRLFICCNNQLAGAQDVLFKISRHVYQGFQHETGRAKRRQHFSGNRTLLVMLRGHNFKTLHILCWHFVTLPGHVAYSLVIHVSSVVFSFGGFSISTDAM